MSARRRRVRVEDLLGRRVHDAEGRPVGRIEEIRVKRRNDAYEVAEYLLGTGALVERLALIWRWFGRRPQMLVARWDQLDIHRPEQPVITCAIEELRHE
jgi:hypothetical protein